MDTIFIHDLITSGAHGVHKREKDNPQKYRVSVSIAFDTTKAGQSDAIADTFNYESLKEYIISVFHGPSRNLLESLAETIAQHILTDLRVHEVIVQIEKIEIWSDGVPGVIVRRQKKNHG